MHELSETKDSRLSSPIRSIAREDISDKANSANWGGDNAAVDNRRFFVG